MDTIKQSE
jgi:enamine deaminase RidA (YjgF/YER057c/UK114 family)